MLRTRQGLTLLLVVVFACNWAETAGETWLKERFGFGAEVSYQIANAIHWLEGRFSFEYHDATNRVAVYGYSISYFFLFPLLALALAWALARREDSSAYRVFALAVAADYTASLPFYLFFPVPERWAYPDSAAMLLSDRWNAKLIETIRPMSGLDNCFPSFHVSLTVIVVAISFLYAVRLRRCVAALSLTIVLSTYTLGVHWLADIGAGIGVGLLSVWAARRIDASMKKAEEAAPAWSSRAQAAHA